MYSFFSRIKISRIFILSITFLTFVIFFISTIFSTFIYNNSKQQLIESLYIQAKSINALIPQINEINGNDLNNLVNELDLKGNNEDRLRVTIINENWVVVADSFLNIQQLKLIEKHSPDTRVEIKNALIGDYGTDTRVSNTTGDELIYVAIQVS